MIKKHIVFLFAVIILFSAGTLFPGTILVPDDYEKIQQAIDAAVSDDTVLVKHGIYLENLQIVDKSICLISQAGVKKTVIDGRGGDVILCEGSGSSYIGGFTIRNGNRGIISSTYLANSQFIENNVITGNRLGVYIGDMQQTRIFGNRIEKKSPDGGVHVQDSSPEIYNNIFYANESRWGGGIHCESAVITGYPKIINNTIVKNKAEQGGGLFIGWDSHTIIMNNIIVQNIGEGGVYIGPNGDPEISYNDVWENADNNYVNCTPGIGDVSLDPLFLGETNFHLQSSSPCRDAGKPSDKYNDNDSTRNDLGATGGPFFIRDFIVDIADEHDAALHLPEISLYQNYPNPFNAVTFITYGLPNSAAVELEVYNILGKQVAGLIEKKQIAGKYEIKWDAKEMPSGIYLYKLSAGEFVKTKKMMLLK